MTLRDNERVIVLGNRDFKDLRILVLGIRGLPLPTHLDSGQLKKPSNDTGGVDLFGRRLDRSSLLLRLETEETRLASLQ